MEKERFGVYKVSPQKVRILYINNASMCIFAEQEWRSCFPGCCWRPCADVLYILYSSVVLGCIDDNHDIMDTDFMKLRECLNCRDALIIAFFLSLFCVWAYFKYKPIYHKVVVLSFFYLSGFYGLTNTLYIYNECICIFILNISISGHFVVPQIENTCIYPIEIS